MKDYQTDFVRNNQPDVEWRKRTMRLMKERGLNQSSLAKEMYRSEQEKRNGELEIDWTASEHIAGKANCERNIGRYLKAGIDGKRFPKFEHMLEIADFFGVSIGFLIGETDCKSFDAQMVSEYLGLSEDAVKTVKLASSYEAAIGAAKTSIDETNKPLDKVLTSPRLLRLMEALLELELAYTAPNPWKKEWESIEREFDTEILAKALDLQGAFVPEGLHPENNAEEAERREYNEAILLEAGINDSNREEFLRARSRVESYLDGEYNASVDKENLTEAKRYLLIREFSNLVDELYPR